MQRSAVTALTAALLLAPFGLGAWSQQPAVAQACDGSATSGVTPRQLKPGVHALITDPRRDGLGSNTGFVVTSAGVVVIDAGMPGMQWRRVREEIGKVTKLPIVDLILTHKHWDHVLATPLVAGAGAGIRVMAHAKAAEAMAGRFPGRLARIAEQGGELARALAGATTVLPTETVSTRREIRIGETRFELIPFGPAHTGGDLAVLLPDQKVLFAGDLLFNLPHPWAGDGEMNVEGWQAALERIESMDVELVVPGHGEVGGRDAARRQRAYLGDLARMARQGFAEGCPPEEVAERVRLERGQEPAEVAFLIDSLKELYRRQATEVPPPR